MKKVVVKVDLHDEKQKQKAMCAVSCLTGIDSIEMNMKDKKLTVVGDVDPVDVVKKLKKYWCTEILTVGPAKEEKKKEETKKEDKKDDKDKKKEDPWKGYYPPPTYYYIPIHEDNPNSCAIL